MFNKVRCLSLYAYSMVTTAFHSCTPVCAMSSTRIKNCGSVVLIACQSRRRCPFLHRMGTKGEACGVAAMYNRHATTLSTWMTRCVHRTLFGERSAKCVNRTLFGDRLLCDCCDNSVAAPCLCRGCGATALSLLCPHSVSLLCPCLSLPCQGSVAASLSSDGL